MKFCNEKNRIEHKKRALETEAEDEVLQQKEQDRTYKSKKRALETEDEVLQNRIEQSYKSKKRALETEEESLQRKKKDMAYKNTRAKREH